MTDEPSFEIPVRPTRKYDGQQITREGGTVFELRPERDEIPIHQSIKSVLSRPSYVFGDWFELPKPVYLVYDTEINTVFRVVVIDSYVELQVMPSTDARALKRFYDRVAAQTDTVWSVRRRIDRPE